MGRVVRRCWCWEDLANGSARVAVQVQAFGGHFEHLADLWKASQETIKHDIKKIKEGFCMTREMCL